MTWVRRTARGADRALRESRWFRLAGWALLAAAFGTLYLPGWLPWLAPLVAVVAGEVLGGAGYLHGWSRGHTAGWAEGYKEGGEDAPDGW